MTILRIQDVDDDTTYTEIIDTEREIDFDTCVLCVAPSRLSSFLPFFLPFLPFQTVLVNTLPQGFKDCDARYLLQFNQNQAAG